MPLTDSSVPVSRPRAERYRTLVVGAAHWIGRGAVVGVVASLVLLAVESPQTASDTAFALGALVLGFGVTAWSGAVGLGETIEGMQHHLDVSSGWTQAGARQAFFVVSWFGAGWVLGTIAASFAFGVS